MYPRNDAMAAPTWYSPMLKTPSHMSVRGLSLGNVSTAKAVGCAILEKMVFACINNDSIPTALAAVRTLM